EKSNFFIGGLSFKTIIVGQDKYVYKSMKNAECVIYKNEKIALKKTRPYGGLGHVRESGCYLYIDEGENVFVLLSILLCLDFDFYRDSFRE
ncbi:MAG: hypothetical protein RL757_1339, partial [Bacteroidota bacterium]